MRPCPGSYARRRTQSRGTVSYPDPACRNRLTQKITHERISVSLIPEILMRTYNDLAMDLTDATLVHVAMYTGVESVFNLDVKDFSVYRLDKAKSLKTIPHSTCSMRPARLSPDCLRRSIEADPSIRNLPWRIPFRLPRSIRPLSSEKRSGTR